MCPCGIRMSLPSRTLKRNLCSMFKLENPQRVVILGKQWWFLLFFHLLSPGLFPQFLKYLCNELWSVCPSTISSTFQHLSSPEVYGHSERCFLLLSVYGLGKKAERRKRVCLGLGRCCSSVLRSHAFCCVRSQLAREDLAGFELRGRLETSLWSSVSVDVR